MKKIYVYLFVLTAMLLRATALHAQEPYAVLSDDNTVLTFYYDTQKAARGGMSVGPFYYYEVDPMLTRPTQAKRSPVPVGDVDYGKDIGEEKIYTNISWYNERETITTVEFDPSFANCTSLTSTAFWFYECSRLATISGMENLYTGNVTDMSYMFDYCVSLTSLDLSGFNTAKVTNMSHMFAYCTGLTSLDVSGFNTAKVTNMRYMFLGCTNLTSLDVSGFNTVNVTDMNSMFYNCNSLTSLDLSSFNTGKVTNMNFMFMYCSGLKTIYVGDGWTTNKVSNGNAVFRDCTSLVGEKGTAYDSSHDDYTYALIDYGETVPGYLTVGSLPYAVLSDDNTKLTFYYDKQKDTRGGMSIGPFLYDYANKAPTSSWYLQRETITTVVFDASFASCTSLTNTSYWFYECESLTTITGIKNLKTDNVTRMHHMFYGCSRLKSLDLSGFNTDNVTRMDYMFNGCSRLQSLDVSGFNTSNVIAMSGMFGGCENLTSLDLSSFNTSNVTLMDEMFYQNSWLESLDLSGFNTQNVTNMNSMFYGCYSLATIFAGKWSTNKVTNSEDMFYGCESLVGGLGTVYDASHTDQAYAHFDGGEADPGYLTGVPVPYAVLSNDGTVLTFYYDAQKAARGGMDVGPFYYEATDPELIRPNQAKRSPVDYIDYGEDIGEEKIDTNISWYNEKETITTVEFDPSFANCTSLTSTAYWFYECYNLTTITGMENLKTDNVTEMNDMFAGCSSLKVLDLRSFNTSNVTTMEKMFRDCYRLTAIYVGENWSTENVEKGSYMFFYCTDLVGGQGTAYDSSHTDQTYARLDEGEASPGYLSEKVEPYAVLSADGTVLTFYYGTERIARGGLGVKPYSSSNEWNEHRGTITTVVFDPSFADCTSLPSTASWFYHCENLTTITGIKNLKTDNVTDMSSMFSGCKSLKSLDLSGFNTDNVTNMSNMFLGCTNLTTLDLSGFNTQNVTDMGSMFFSCTSLANLDISNFNTSNVKHMGSMFYNCSSLTTLDISSFNTASVIDMNEMFVGGSSLTTIYASSTWTTESVQFWDMGMFTGCTKLVGSEGTTYDEIYLDYVYARIDGGGQAPGYFTAGNEPYAVLNDDGTVLTFYYDAQKAERDGMSVGPFGIDEQLWEPSTSWYRNRSTITTVVFDPSFARYTLLTSTAYWFCNCEKLTTITGLEHLNTKDVTTMYYMFSGCSSLTTLDLSSFNIANVIEMDNMFSNCSSLSTIYAGDGWSKNHAAGLDTFKGCTSLVGGQGTAFQAWMSNSYYARIDGGEDAPGYFTEKIVVGLGDTANILRRNANAPIYDLSGRRLTIPKKGVNIVGGRKVVVK